MKEQYTTNISMKGQVCVVTGANSGIGYETSLQLAKHGAHLVMVCLDKKPGEEAKAQIEAEAKGPVDLVLCDLSSLEEVRILAKTLLDNHPKINILINNAGVQYNRRQTTVDGYEAVFAINYLAPFLLTRLLVDRMKASTPARIINVSSKGHQFGGLDLNDLHWEKRRYRGLKGYGASKVAVNLFTLLLSDKLKNTGVTVNAVHPGAVHSNIAMTNGPVYLFIRKYILNRMLKPAHHAGSALYYLAAGPELRFITGKYFNMTHQEKPWDPSCDRSLGRTLWAISEQLTGPVKPTNTV